MIIGNIVINRASKIRKLLLRKPTTNIDKKLWEELMHMYACRIFGFCVYRTNNKIIRDRQKIIAEQHDL